MWSESKFQKRLSDMVAWYSGTSNKNNNSEIEEFDPWFEPSDAYTEEKNNLDHMKPRDAV